MNKKEKNRKNVAQNLRNRLINRRYKSTVKTLTKNLKKVLKDIIKSGKEEVQSEKKEIIQKNQNLIFSFIDKSVKKNIFHKNKAGRKKSRLIRFINKTLDLLKP